MKIFWEKLKSSLAVVLGALTAWVPLALLFAWAGLEVPDTIWLLIALGVGYEIGRESRD